MNTLLESSLFINRGTLIHQTLLRYHILFFLIVATGTTSSALAQATFMPAFPDSIYGPPWRPLLIQLLEWAKSLNTHSLKWNLDVLWKTDLWLKGNRSPRIEVSSFLTLEKALTWASHSSSRGLWEWAAVCTVTTSAREASLDWSSLLPFFHLSFLLRESHFLIKHCYFIIGPDFWGTQSKIP